MSDDKLERFKDLYNFIVRIEWIKKATGLENGEAIRLYILNNEDAPLTIQLVQNPKIAEVKEKTGLHSHTCRDLLRRSKWDVESAIQLARQKHWLPAMRD